MEVETYNVHVTCENCSKVFAADIQKGRTIEDYITKTDCPHCGCMLSGTGYYVNPWQTWPFTPSETTTTWPTCLSKGCRISMYDGFTDSTPADDRDE